jgi:hypothetical protein
MGTSEPAAIGDSRKRSRDPGEALVCQLSLDFSPRAALEKLSKATSLEDSLIFIATLNFINDML